MKHLRARPDIVSGFEIRLNKSIATPTREDHYRFGMRIAAEASPLKHVDQRLHGRESKSIRRPSIP